LEGAILLFNGFSRNDFKIVDGTREGNDPEVKRLADKLKEQLGTDLRSKLIEEYGKRFKINIGGRYPYPDPTPYLRLSLTLRSGKGYTHYPQLNVEINKEGIITFFDLEGSSTVKKDNQRKKLKDFSSNLIKFIENKSKFLKWLKDNFDGDYYIDIGGMDKNANEISEDDIDRIIKDIPEYGFSLAREYGPKYVITSKKEFVGNVLDDFKKYWPLFSSSMGLIGETIDEENSSSDRDTLVGLLTNHKQLIFYGPPGTGKTYTARKIAVEFIEGG